MSERRPTFAELKAEFLTNQFKIRDERISHLEAEPEKAKTQTVEECVKLCRRLAEDYKEITHNRLRRGDVERSRASAECVEALLEAVKQIKERLGGTRP